jgi:hypothetical protein
MKYDYLVKDGTKEAIIEMDQKISDSPYKTFREIYEALECNDWPIFDFDTPVTRLVCSGTGVLWNCSRSTL